MKKNIQIIFLRAISLIFSFGLGVLITRSLSVYDRGMYVEFITWSSIGTVLISYGLPVYILREGTRKNSKKLVINGFFISSVLAICFSSILIIFKNVELTYFYVSLFSFLTYGITYYRHYLLSKGKMILFELLLSIPVLISLIVVAIVYILYPNSLTINVWISSVILGPFLYFIFKLLTESTFFSLFKLIELNVIKKTLYNASSFFIVSISGIFFTKAPYIYMSLNNQIDNMAYFGIADVIPALFISVCASLVSINSFSIFGTEMKFHLKLIFKSILFIFFLYVIALVICIFFGNFLITFVYGDEYLISVSILNILLTSAFVITITNIIFNAFISQNATYLGVIPALITCLFFVLIYYFKYEFSLIQLAYFLLFLSIITFFTYVIIFFKMYFYNKNYLNI